MIALGDKIFKKKQNKKKSIFYQGTSLDKKRVNREVKQEIRRAKLGYKTSVEEKLINGSIQSARRGMKAMAEIKK